MIKASGGNEFMKKRKQTPFTLSRKLICWLICLGFLLVFLIGCPVPKNTTENTSDGQPIIRDIDTKIVTPVPGMRSGNSDTKTKDDVK